VNATTILLLMLIVVVIAVGVLIFLGRRRSAVLRQQTAEAELAAREKRVRNLNVGSLMPEEEARLGSR
jgi:cell division protein FtsL